MNYPTCPVCGRQFHPTNWNQKYCSTKCARQAQAKQNMSHIVRRSQIKSSIPQRILYAFHFQCCVCGWNIPQDFEDVDYQPQHGCEFHHIVPVSKGGENTLDNIVLLCPNCHKMAHAGMFNDDALRKRTKTLEEADEQRERYALEAECGTYWIDYLMLNKGNFRKRIANGEEI